MLIKLHKIDQNHVCRVVVCGIKAVLALLLAVLFLPPVFDYDQKEQEGVKDSADVLKEVLNIPDDIPQDLIGKAECLVILPPVKKGASKSAAASAVAL
jgi:hypothetical protein